MHVAHILEAVEGGARRHLHYIVPALCRAGIGIDLILGERRRDPDFDTDLKCFEELGCGISTFDAGREPGVSDIGAFKAIASALETKRPDVVHTHCAKGGFLGRRAARKLGIPAVHTPHSFFFEGLENAFKKRAGIEFERYWGHRCNRLICISDAEADVAKTNEIIQADRIVVARNGIPDDFDTNLISRSEARGVFDVSDEDTVAIGVFARLAEKKGHPALFDAVAQMPAAAKRRIKLCIAGDGHSRALLESLACDLDITDRVMFAGYVPDAHRLLPGMDMCVLPSSYEGLPYQLLESLAAGVPMIASDIPGNRPAAPDNPVVYVPHDDAAALAAALTKWTDNAAPRRQAGVDGRAWVSTHFRLRDQVAALQECYCAVTQS